MPEYVVEFACNPDYYRMPAARSKRRVTVDSWEEIPDACAKARNHNGPVVITNLWMVGT